MSETSKTASVLDVSGLGFRYAKKPALENVEFSIAKGEFTILLGHNGAGKTTLFSLITRLYDPHGGKIHINGVELRKNPGSALARMGVVFQQPTLDLDLTVRQNMLYHAALHGMSRQRADRRLDEELSRLDIKELRGEKVRKLSGGYRRRVEIARALLHEPKILLLDEPTVGLDVPTRSGIVDHVHRLATVEGLSVLWATHLIDEVRESDSVVVLHKGKVRARGRVSDVVKMTGAQNIGKAFEILVTESV